jgi:hypothetical protein
MGDGTGPSDLADISGYIMLGSKKLTLRIRVEETGEAQVDADLAGEGGDAAEEQAWAAGPGSEQDGEQDRGADDEATPDELEDEVSPDELGDEAEEPEEPGEPEGAAASDEDTEPEEADESDRSAEDLGESDEDTEGAEDSEDAEGAEELDDEA